jgi:putative NADPH-quinone reductase
VRRIAIIQGNPDPKGGHYDHALARAYTEAAERAGHTVQVLEVAQLEFPWLRTEEDFNSGGVPPAIRAVQEILGEADHLLIIFPLWHGTMPAVLKAFFEQTFRPGFAMENRPGRLPRRLLKGKSARVVVTMGMPAFLYRWLFRAYGVKCLNRSILWWSGISPVRTCLIGNIADRNGGYHQRWLEQLHTWGTRAQ